MKYLSQIQLEFLKTATQWEDNPEDYQRRYLHKHPKSKKRIRIRPIVQIDQQNPETETFEILKEISKLPYDTFYGEALNEAKDVLEMDRPSLYDLRHVISRWYTISANSQYQRQNPEKVEKMRLLAGALKDKEERQNLIEEAKRQIVKDLADDILKEVREKGLEDEDKQEVTGVSGEDLERIDSMTKDIARAMKEHRQFTNEMPTDQEISNEVNEQMDDETTDIKERVKKEVVRILQEQESENDTSNSKSEFDKSIDEADKIVHPVEKEWHYPLMTKYGYVPLTKSGIGFVRTFQWHNPETDHKITHHVGVNADYWEANTKPTGFGYWMDLEPFLKRVTNKN